VVRRPDWEGQVTGPSLLVTVDVGGASALERLHLDLQRLGVRPTWLLLPEVLDDPGLVALLRALPDCELGTRLHDDGPLAREYGRERQGRALAVLTERFVQAFGRRPRSFRGSGPALGPGIGRYLLDLGYLVDSSLLCDGPVRPWFVHRCGDLLRPGRSVLLEVPVGPGGGDLPLVLQVPASQSAGRAQLDGLLRAIATLQDRGFVPRTLAEHHAMVMRVRSASEGPERAPSAVSCPSQRDRRVPVPATPVREAVRRHGTQPWHVEAIENRLLRWEATESCAWIAEHFPPSASVLDTGCGVGPNVLWLAGQGFTDLAGFDVDPAAIAVGSELAAGLPAPPRLWVDDGLAPSALPERTFDVVTALNWTYLAEGFDLDAFVRQWSARLNPGGALLIDAIDASYERHPKRRWLTWDWDRPESGRRPSEYRQLWSGEHVQAIAESCGLRVECTFLRPQEIQRIVYVLRKPVRPRVLVVVDEPGWAHDHKAEALCRHLGCEFDMRRCCHKDLQPADLDDTELVVVFYWLQVGGSPEVAAAFARNRHKLLLGVCSHEEVAGARREQALPHLATAAAVFVHNRELFAEVGALLPAHVPLFATPNGVDTGRFHPATGPRTPGPLRVGWAGSLDNFGRELRGYDLIEAACRDLPGVVFTPACKEQQQRSHTQMAAWYRELDVLVCMSRSEGTPNPCLEAAASGVPLLTTAVGNMPEFIASGGNGWLLPREPAALRRALLQLRDDEDLRARAGRLARSTAIGWSWQVQAESFRRMFRAVLGGVARQMPRRWTPDVSVCVRGESERAIALDVEPSLAACAAAGLRCEVVVAPPEEGFAGAMRWFEARAQGEVLVMPGPGWSEMQVGEALAKAQKGAVLVAARDGRGAIARRQHLRTFAIAPDAGAAALQWDALGRLLRGKGLPVAATA
jgi:glycosyltransferase involved in cell wall biosynthesis